jgi:hypothetical protein
MFHDPTDFGDLLAGIGHVFNEVEKSTPSNVASGFFSCGKPVKTFKL